MRFVRWSEGMRHALYAPGGFFHQPGGPAAHFRTSVHASPQFAEAVLRLLRAVDGALGSPDRIDLVDVGSGRGELLVQVLARVDRELAARLHLTAVELAARPAELPAAITWADELPEDVVGLLLANEWLDNVPLDVVEMGPDGVRQVLVDLRTGAESPGGPIGMRDSAWLARWWPLSAEVETRAEVGFPRDDAWAGAVRSLARGVAVAVDYGHLLDQRADGDFARGSLTGYRKGRLVPPVPDGSCDLTAHVAMDACAAAGLAAGARSSLLLRQREALHRLGVTSAELTDGAGLGAFWWLVQPVGCDLPAHLLPGSPAGADAQPRSSGTEA